MRWTVSLLAFVILTLVSGCDLQAPTGPMAPWAFSGLDGRDVQELVVRNNTLYAATDSGLFRKPIDLRTGWAPDGLEGKHVVDVTWRGDGSMLAGVEYNGDANGPVLYKRSAPSGTGWTPFDQGYGPSGDQPVNALAATPHSHDTLYARGARNVSRSVDGGQSWESVLDDWNAAGYQAPLLYVSPQRPGVVFAGGETSIFQPYLTHSPDYGATWQPSSGLPDDGDNAVYSIIEHPDDPNQMLLGMEGHVLRSHDGGDSWTTIYEPPEYPYIFDFVARSNGSRTVVYAAGSEDGTQAGELTLHRTDDFGDTWERIVYSDGPAPAAIRSMKLVEANGRTHLYLGTTVGVYVYTP